MEPGPGEPEYTLVSAVNGSEEGATYTYSGEGYSPEQRETEFGSLASARSAMSADGEHVAFITTAQSDLLAEAEPTPAGEVLVRDVGTRETRLVSAEYQPGIGWGADRPVPPSAQRGRRRPVYGAVYPEVWKRRPSALPGARPRKTTGEVARRVDQRQRRTWSSWMGQQLGEQAQLLPNEQADEPPQTAEPLWRRISEGPAAPDPPRHRRLGSDEPRRVKRAGEQEIPERFPAPLDPCTGPFEHYPKNRARKGSGAQQSGTPTSCRS